MDYWIKRDTNSHLLAGGAYIVGGVIGTPATLLKSEVAVIFNESSRKPKEFVVLQLQKSNLLLYNREYIQESIQDCGKQWLSFFWTARNCSSITAFEYIDGYNTLTNVWDPQYHLFQWVYLSLSIKSISAKWNEID